MGIKRPSGSLTEAAFVARIAASFPRYLQAIDEAGNVHFKIGESRTLFAAHADTVHWEEGVNKYTQEGSTVKASGAPLGADDGAQGKPLPRSAFIRMKRPTIETESEYVALYATQPVTNHSNEITTKATKVTP